MSEAADIARSLGQEIVAHPYYPRDAHIPHYVPSKLSIVGAFAVLGGAVCVVVILSTIALRFAKRPLSLSDKLTYFWFVACALIHIVLEGYFSFNHGTLAGKTTVLADLWREYSHSDSRYLTSDPFTVIMEGITAIFDGNLAIATAYGIITGSPFRHVAQLLCSLAQIYGNILYLLTAYMDGFIYSNPHPFYFYGYFVFMNAIWIFVPTTLLIQSCRAIYRGMSLAQLVDGKKKTN